MQASDEAAHSATSADVSFSTTNGSLQFRIPIPAVPKSGDDDRFCLCWLFCADGSDWHKLLEDVGDGARCTEPFGRHGSAAKKLN
eukprot:SAG31_NODE_3180_length_4582_cov_2.985501_6_plen_85_part_00